MNSRFTQQGTDEAVRTWGDRHGEDFALRLYTARLIGADPALVLHGGGNVSLKRDDVTTPIGDTTDLLFVKRSGADLADLQPADLPALELGPLLRLGSRENLSDEVMMNELRRTRLNSADATPSVETLVHAVLPHRFVDHSHADALLAITNRPDGEQLVREAVGENVAVLPYVRPGLELARQVAQCIAKSPNVDGIVLVKHGLLTFADDARTSYERHIAIVDGCERFVRERGDAKRLTVAVSPSSSPAHLAALAAPILRGKLAPPTGCDDRPHRPWLMDWRCDDELLEFVNSTDARKLADSGPLTGDHVIRTKPWPMTIEGWTDGTEDSLRTALDGALQEYRSRYVDYVTRHGGGEPIDWRPRVVLIPGAGLFALGSGKREAIIAADIAEHTIKTKMQSLGIGPYEALSQEHLYDIEHRAFQQAKVTPDQGVAPLAGLVVAISGGAGAIGAAIAEVCAENGAHVAVTDIDQSRINRVVEQLLARFGRDIACGLVMDVTDETAVRDGFDEIVRTFGGVDVVVPNAGIAHVAPIDELSVSDFRRVMEVNAVGHLLFMREGVRIMKRQGIGGSVVINASKNVFGPGRDFGAYSASKAAGHQLGKVAAIELAEHNIRVNMINADAVFGDEQTPSGLWATVGPERAKRRNLREDELPEYYRKRNLLKAKVTGRHVGNAVVFFASNATPTTGATLPVDGGVIEAFPR